jgi:hypothetical protein
LVKLKTISRKKILFICSFFEKNLSEFIPNRTKSIILIDPFTVPEWVITNSYFVNILAKEKESVIKTFSNYSRIESPVDNVIFKSFNVIGHIKTAITNEKLMQEKGNIVADLRSNVKTKKDLFDIKINGVWIGIDIYETYLKKGNPTIDFEDNVLWDTLEEGIELLLFWNDFFSKNNVSGVVLSHDCYTHMNILAKIAYKANVPVYLPYSLGIQKSDRQFSVYENRFKNYRGYFNNLSDREKQDARQWGKERLDLRLSGQVGVDMCYSTISAFIPPNDDTKILCTSSKIKVLIAVHDFYDNPHGYGGMLFTDFYVWLEFLADISNQTNYDWYIKTHPDTSQQTLDVLEGDLLKNSKIKLIPKNTSFPQLAKEGLDFVLTCFGSVGHELPLLGVQVINASTNNPHIAYNFNWHAKSVNHYKKLLLNLSSLNINVDLNEMYEFYYMNYKYTILDDFIYNSYSQMMVDLDENARFSLDAYIYFIKKLSEEKNAEIKRKIKNFIKSEKKNYYIKGPEN